MRNASLQYGNAASSRGTGFVHAPSSGISPAMASVSSGRTSAKAVQTKRFFIADGPRGRRVPAPGENALRECRRVQRRIRRRVVPPVGNVRGSGHAIFGKHDPVSLPLPDGRTSRPEPPRRNIPGREGTGRYTLSISPLRSTPSAGVCFRERRQRDALPNGYCRLFEAAVSYSGPSALWLAVQI